MPRFTSVTNMKWCQPTILPQYRPKLNDLSAAAQFFALYVDFESQSNDSYFVFEAAS
jgi:hypothetical protein